MWHKAVSQHILPALSIVSNVFMRNETESLMFRSRVYNKNKRRKKYLDLTIKLKSYGI